MNATAVDAASPATGTHRDARACPPDPCGLDDCRNCHVDRLARKAENPYHRCLRGNRLPNRGLGNLLEMRFRCGGWKPRAVPAEGDWKPGQMDSSASLRMLGCPTPAQRGTEFQGLADWGAPLRHATGVSLAGFMYS